MKRNVQPLRLLRTLLLRMIILFAIANALQLKAQTILIDPNGDGGFENGSTFGANGWTVVNSLAANRWYVGKAPGTMVGANQAYISSDWGLTNSYDISSPGRSFFYRDITFPANETAIKLSFSWRSQGESYDYLLVCMMPTSQTPAADIPLSPGSDNWTTLATSYPGTVILSSPPNLNSNGTKRSYTVDLPSSFAGTTQRLVFMWSNDNQLGATLPASIDSISIISRLPQTIHSVASGNYSSSSTWQNGKIPTALDSVVIDSGHTVLLDAGGHITFAKLTVNGTINFGSDVASLSVEGNLLVNPDAVLNMYYNTVGKNLNVAGNITNDGRIHLARLGAMLTLDGTSTQTIGGIGILDSSNLVAGITFNNTSLQPIINWNWQHVKVDIGGVKLNGGWISIGDTNSITVGNGSPATITATSGGFTNGTIKRWFNTTGTGSVINPGLVPAFAAGSFPFISGSPTAGYFPAYFHRATAALTTAGTFEVKFIDSLGLNTLTTPASENTYLITKQTKASWTVTTGNGYTSSVNHTFSVQGKGMYTVVTKNARLLLNGSLVGTHQNGTNLPSAERISIPASSVTGVYTIGLDSSEETTFTLGSGAWNNPAIWSNGIPSCTKSAEIRSSDSVWIDAGMTAVNTSHLLLKGSLSVSGSSVTVGCNGQGNTAWIEGKLYVTGGSLTINGSLEFQPSATFNQSGGFINIDGNNAGNIFGSVQSGTPIVGIATNNVALSGGVLTIVDPHAGTTSNANITFLYSATGNINNTNGWTLKLGDGISTDAGGASTPVVGFLPNIVSGKILIDSLIIDAGITGTNRFATLNNGSLWYNNLYITGNGDARISSTTYLAKNLINNGSLTSAGTLCLCSYENATAGPSSFSQTISGTGFFKNNLTTPTANFTNLVINNTSQTGITFATSNTLRSNTNSGTVSGILTLFKGYINTLNDTFVLGISPTSTGTLSFTNDSGGFVSGSTFSRWWGTAASGTSIIGGQIPSTSTGAYPFTNTTGTRIVNRILWLRQTSSSTTGGRISVRYMDSSGTNATTITDGSYTVERVSKAKWAINYSGITGSPIYTAAINGEGIYGTLNANSRIIGESSVLSGTHQTGTLLPHAQRIGIGLTDLKKTWCIGINNNDSAIRPISSGDWNNPLVWSSGTVPNCLDQVVIAPGYSITVSTAPAMARALTISPQGILTVSDSSLTIGCTLNNASLVVGGSLNITGGALNINGNLSVVAGANFLHSGGNINIDGNAGGNIAGSVASGTPIVNIATNNTTFSGGIMTIVDPHTGTTSASNNIAFGYTATLANNNTTGWTLKFGDGLSTDAGGALSTPAGFVINMSGGKILIDSLVIDAGVTGTNRFVTFNNGSVTMGCVDLHITNNGEARISNVTYVAKDIVNNGVLTTTGTVYLGLFVSSTIYPSTFSQTISGTGSFKNNLLTPTANFTNLTINNTHATGVTFSNSNVLRSFTNTGTVSGTFALTRGFVNTLNDTFVLGTGTTTKGLLTYSYDTTGFVSGSAFSRWWGTAVAGSTITTGTLMNSPEGAYPFTTIGPKAFNRSVLLRQTSVSTTGGRISVKYIDSPGTSDTLIADSNYTIDRISKAKWIVSYTGITGSQLYTAGVNGDSIYPSSNGNSRIVGLTATLGGIHQTGTFLPQAQRSAMPLTALNNTWSIGINKADIINRTTTSGNWNDTLIWSKGTVPSCTDSVIISAGDTIVINSYSANARCVFVSAEGELTLNGNTLTVGCVNNNASMVADGVLTVTGGDLNINGSLKITATGVFNQSGGNITIDGNAGGNIAGSVPADVSLLDIQSNSVNWTGGVLTMVDPQVNYNSLAFNFKNPLSVDVSPLHTFVFGNAVSTDNTTSSNGFSIITQDGSSSARFNFGNVIFKGSPASVDNRKVYSVYSLIVRGDFTVNNGGIFETPNTLKIAGNMTVNSGGKAFPNYLSFLLGSGVWTEAPSTVPQIISGSGIIQSSINSTTPWFATSTLTVYNTSAGGVTIARPLGVRISLTFADGIIHTNSADSFYIGTCNGGYQYSYIDGPCYRIISPSRNAAKVYNETTIFPLGKNGKYLPVWVDPSTGSGELTILKAEVLENTNMPPSVPVVSPIVWGISAVRNQANFTGAFIRLRDTASILTDSSQILYSPSSTDMYSVVKPSSVPNYTPGIVKYLGTPSKLSTVNFNGLYTYGRLNGCSTPTSQPTSFTASNIQSTAFDASFTAAAGNPSHYLTVRHPSGAGITPPVNNTIYDIGTAIGTGTIVSNQTGTSFSQSGLALNTTYQYYTYSYNNSNCFGPMYDTISPLFALVTTCATTVPALSAPLGYNINFSNFSVKWSKSAIVGATYKIDVSETSNFSSFVSGYQNASVLDTFIHVTGLSSFTTYYVRVRVVNNTCVSAYSLSTNIKTLCAPATVPYTLNFEADSFPCNKIEKFTSANGWTFASSPGYGFTDKTLATPSTNLIAADAWLYTQALNLTAGVHYRISFRYGTNNNNSIQKFAVCAGLLPNRSDMRDTIVVLSAINNIESQIFVVDYTPAISGFYYIGLNCLAPARNSSNLYIDDFKVDLSPTLCEVPTNLFVEGLTNQSAVLKWTKPSSVPSGGYAYYLQSERVDPYPTNETPATGVVAGGDSSITITGLVVGKKYNIWMRSICGTDSSAWCAKPASFTSGCGFVSSFPWKEDFEEVQTPALPPCFTEINANQNPNSFMTSATGTPIVYTQAAGLFTAGNSSNNDYLILPPIALTGHQQLRYALKTASTIQPHYYQVVLSTTGKNDTDFNTILKPLTGVTSVSSFVWDSVSLASYNDTVYIAFRVVPGVLVGNSNTLYIDNIIVEDLPACVTPFTPTIQYLRSTSAGIVWPDVLPTPANGYQYELRASAPAGSGSSGLIYSGSTTTHTVSLSGLVPDSLYTLYVRSDCNGSYSSWRALSFRTLCPPLNIPFTQNFEGVVVPNVSKCEKIEKTGSGNNWATVNNPGGGFTTKILRYVGNAYDANAWYYTQGMNLTAGINYRITFKYGNLPSGAQDKLLVKFDTIQSMGMKDTLALLNGFTGGFGYYSYTKDFAPSVSGEYYLGFNCFSGTSSSSVYIDDISIELSPCLPPQNIAVNTVSSHSVALGWSASASMPYNGYQWELRSSGVAGSGATGLIAIGSDSLKTLMASIDGLSSNSAFTFYVRSNCDTSSSIWQSLAFRTKCDSTTVPYLQNFETLAFGNVDVCDKREAGAGASPNWTIGYNSGFGFTNSCLYFDISNTNQSAWYFTQGIYLRSGFTYKLKFKHGNSDTYIFPNYPGEFAATLGSDPTSAAVSDTILSFSFSGPNNATNYEGNITPTTSGVYYLGMYCSTSAFSYHVFVDDIQIEESSCLPPVNLQVSGVSTMTLSWGASLSSLTTGYQYEVRTSGNIGSGATGLLASGTTALTTTSVVLPALLVDTLYKMYVRSSCTNGFSEWDSISYQHQNSLPVDLVSFSGETDGGDALLHWTTTNETNNKGFVIERSTDGRLFTDIAFVKGKGTSTRIANYMKTDVQAFEKSGADILYYRLRQLDFDGKTAYSSIIKVEHETRQLLSNIQAHPNPFNSEVDIVFESTVQDNYTIAITDIQGREVTTMIIPTHKGLNTITLKNLTNLEPGVYIVKLIGREQHTIKLVKAD